MCMIVTYTTPVSTRFLKCHDCRVVDLDTEYSCTVWLARPVKIEGLLSTSGLIIEIFMTPKIVKG